MLGTSIAGRAEPIFEPRMRLAVGGEPAGIDGRRDTRGGHADQHGRAVALHQRDTLFGRPLDADGDEHRVGLAAGSDLGDPRRHVLAPRVHAVGRAEFARCLELGADPRRPR